jgi:hypothetical protein
MEVNDELIDKIINVLTRFLPKKVKLATQRLFNTWNEFLAAFCRVGGIIEAAPTCLNNQMSSPSISFLIEPDGTV